MRGRCRKCKKELGGHGSHKTGLCMKCRSLLGLNTAGGRGQNHVRAICWNRKCNRFFMCPPDRDPRYSLCPLCIDKRDNQYSTSPHMRAIY